MHFERESAVHKSLEKVSHRLAELGIPYAIAGGMALFFHGYRRFTEDIDILVTPEGLEEIRRRLEGFTQSKQLRDGEFGVRVDFLVTGDYPGDGKPKPIAFPDPADSSTEIQGLRLLQLPQLVELKLASGMSNPRRLSDLGDVQALIEALDLPEAFETELHPFVQYKFREIWDAVHTNPP